MHTRFFQRCLDIRLNLFCRRNSAAMLHFYPVKRRMGAADKHDLVPPRQRCRTRCADRKVGLEPNDDNLRVGGDHVGEVGACKRIVLHLVDHQLILTHGEDELPAWRVRLVRVACVACVADVDYERWRACVASLGDNACEVVANGECSRDTDGGIGKHGDLNVEQEQDVVRVWRMTVRRR